MRFLFGVKKTHSAGMACANSEIPQLNAEERGVYMTGGRSTVEKKVYQGQFVSLILGIKIQCRHDIQAATFWNNKNK